ncbi:MAG: Bax inhibitor-1/YccA family protein [Bifidobacterium sp.]|nr:Bax inhibitor-1/YccA family protein [Bifidobacterium sp.]
MQNTPYGAAGQQPYGQQPYYGGQPVMDSRAAYSYERAEHVSVTKAYGEMTIGLVVTAVVAILTQMTGFYRSFIMATGAFGVWIPAIVQIALAIWLGAKVMTMKPSTARVAFYVFAALMGVTMSTIFGAYNLGTIGFAFIVCAVFYLALTMFGLTTKGNMLKAGPILMIGLIVLILAEVVLMFVAPTDTMLKVITALGIILFAGMTIYDAQFTKRVFAQYANQGPEMIQRVSILCALNLYLDFINMFLYILQLFGLNSRD